MTAHIDVFPTLAEIAGAKLPADVQVQVEGRSLVGLLKNQRAEFADRYLVTHCGRWRRGHAAKAKFAQCSIRNGRFTLVNNAELYDLQKDPGETTNVLTGHPEVVAALRAAYDRWWNDVLPRLENEDAIGPDVNPFKERYWKQFGGGPDAELGPDETGAGSAITGAAREASETPDRRDGGSPILPRSSQSKRPNEWPPSRSRFRHVRSQPAVSGIENEIANTATPRLDPVRLAAPSAAERGQHPALRRAAPVEPRCRDWP